MKWFQRRLRSDFKSQEELQKEEEHRLNVIAAGRASGLDDSVCRIILSDELAAKKTPEELRDYIDYQKGLVAMGFWEKLDNDLRQLTLR